MKILYHHRTQAEDAQGIHIAEIIKAFRKLGHSVKEISLVSREEGAGSREQKTDSRSQTVRMQGIASLRGKDKFWAILARSSPKALYETMEIAYNLVGYYKLSQAIHQFQPDFIYERYALYTFAGILAAKRYHLPLILEVNSPLAYEQKVYGKLIFPKIAQSLERWITSHSTKVVVVSTPLKKHLVQLGVPDHQLEVIPNGIDPKQFHPDISGEPIRKKYHLEGKVVLGFIGWFRPWHGLEMLLEVMVQGALKDTPVHLLLIGEGPIDATLERYVETHRLSRQVTFTGAICREELAAYIAAMDIALQPSATPYASPMKLFEYMGMGKAIVAPRQENIEEILVDGESGVLFEPFDKKALEEAILRCVRDPSLRQRIGRKAQERIFEKKYLWEENAKKVLQIVQTGG